MGIGKTWTNEEIEFLRESWGRMSIKSLAQNLGRTENSILNKKNKLGLGPFLDSGEYCTVNQLLKTIGINGGTAYKKISWVKNRDFPVKKKRVGKNTFNVVRLVDFWKWAEKNKSFLDFSDFPKHALGSEPTWVNEKRIHDKLRKQEVLKTPWTKQEDEKLVYLVKQQKYTYSEISEKLRRTEGAILKRLNDLNIKDRPIRRDNHIVWSEKEKEILSSNIKKCFSYEELKKLIPDKSTKAIKGYIYRLYLSENLDTVRAIIGNGNFGDNIPPKRIKHLCLITGNQKKEVKDNLSYLCYLLIERAKQISNVREEYKEFWQKDTCRNWDDALGCLCNELSCDSCTAYERIRPQYCRRCGATVYSRKEIDICDDCKIARKKQAQKKWAVMNSRKIDKSK